MQNPIHGHEGQNLGQNDSRFEENNLYELTENRPEETIPRGKSIRGNRVRAESRL